MGDEGGLVRFHESAALVVLALLAPSKHCHQMEGRSAMIRKLKTGQYRLYSRKLDAKTGKRKNLGTFATREDAERHERAVQFFKHRH
jgi:hypothetical protein